MNHEPETTGDDPFEPNDAEAEAAQAPPGAGPDGAAVASAPRPRAAQARLEAPRGGGAAAPRARSETADPTPEAQPETVETALEAAAGQGGTPASEHAADDDATDEDATDEDATDEDATDEDATDDDATDDDAADDDATDDDATDDDAADDDATDDDAADDDAADDDAADDDATDDDATDDDATDDDAEVLAALAKLSDRLFERMCRGIPVRVLMTELQKVDRAVYFRYFKGHRASRIDARRLAKVLRRELFERENVLLAQLVVYNWDEHQWRLFGALQKHIKAIDEDVEAIESISDAEADPIFDDLETSTDARGRRRFDRRDVAIACIINGVRVSDEYGRGRWGDLLG